MLKNLLIISLMALASFVYCEDVAQVTGTEIQQLHANVDPVSKKIEAIQVYDANGVVDSTGNVYKTPFRMTVITRETHPALFAEIDKVVANTVARDAAHKARKIAEQAQREALEAARQAAGQPAPQP